MGYFINEIAKITKTPTKVSLSGNPNFIEFSSKRSENSDRIKVTYKIREDIKEATNMNISFEEIATGIVHEFKGTTKKEEVSDTVFYVDINNNKTTANNLRKCLMKNAFFGTRFTISPPFKVTEKRVDGKLVSEMTESELITFESKGSGEQYRFKRLEPNDNEQILTFINGLPDLSSSNDSISEGNANCELHIDIYKDNGVFLGMDDAPEQAYHNAGSEYLSRRNKYGKYVTTLTKSYYNQPAWFNLNAIAANDNSKKIPIGYSWADTGTMSDIRLIASRYMNGENMCLVIIYIIIRPYRQAQSGYISPNRL